MAKHSKNAVVATAGPPQKEAKAADDPLAYRGAFQAGEAVCDGRPPTLDL